MATRSWCRVPTIPLWTAAVTSEPRARGALPVSAASNDFVPDPAEVARLVTPRTRALVVINPNNPTGAVYPRAMLEALARLAEEHGLVLFSDEIYDQMVYDEARFVPLATAGARHAVLHAVRDCRRCTARAATA